jgi:hypothetical protein
VREYTVGIIGPNIDSVLYQILNVLGARQEPQEFMNNAFPPDIFTGKEWEPVIEIIAVCNTKNASCVHTCAVLINFTMITYLTKCIEVLILRMLGHSTILRVEFTFVFWLP